MRRLQFFACAALLISALSSNAIAGSITTLKTNRSGSITTLKSGSITTLKSGSITTLKSGSITTLSTDEGTASQSFTRFSFGEFVANMWFFLAL